MSNQASRAGRRGRRSVEDPCPGTASTDRRGARRPDGESESVVSVLHKLRDEFDVDAEAEDVRSDLQSLRRKGVVEVEYRTVPTFRLAVSRDELEVSVSD